MPRAWRKVFASRRPSLRRGLGQSIPSQPSRMIGTSSRRIARELCLRRLAPIPLHFPTPGLPLRFILLRAWLLPARLRFILGLLRSHVPVAMPRLPSDQAWLGKQRSPTPIVRLTKGSDVNSMNKWP